MSRQTWARADGPMMLMAWADAILDQRGNRGRREPAPATRENQPARDTARADRKKGSTMTKKKASGGRVVARFNIHIKIRIGGDGGAEKG